MAAFFALNITQFRRDKGGTLDLAYVSEIMCTQNICHLISMPSRLTDTGLAVPISAAITAILIYFAFKVEDLEIGLQKIGLKKADGDSKDDSKGMCDNAKEETWVERWTKQVSWDLTEQSAPRQRKTTTTREDTVVSKGKEVSDGDVEAQRDAAGSN